MEPSELKRVPYTHEDRLKIKSMLDQGFTMSKIAIEFGRTLHSITGEITRRGGVLRYSTAIYKRAVPRDSYTLEQRITLQEELRKGTSIAQISIIINRSVGSINHELNKNGGVRNYNAELANTGHNVLKPKAKPLNLNSRIYKNDLNKRIENIEFQLEIITQTLEEILNGKNN